MMLLGVLSIKAWITGRMTVPQNMSRRELFRYSGLGIGLLAAGAEGLEHASASESERTLAKSIPIVDTHQHLWDFRKFRPPWLKSEPKLNHSTTIADYYRAAAGLNIINTIYMEVGVALRQQLQEAEWVIDVCRKHNTPMAAGVVSCRPALPGFETYARRFKSNPYVKGMRQVLQVPEAPKGLCVSPRFVENMNLLGELGLSFDICIRPGELSDGIQLADLCPDTRFILDHCGNAAARNPHQAQWEEDIAEFGKRKNVVCKISGVIKTVKPEWNAGKELEHIVHHCIKSFGTDRVMFGGDWPVCNNTSSLRGWVETLQWIVRDMPEEDKRKLFAGNAIRFYALKPDNTHKG